MTGGTASPRREAWELLGGEYDVRVLEPSPPAVTEPPWYADDPLAGPYGVRLVTPVAGLGRSWDDLVGERPDLAAFCADRWLGARRRLAPLPRAFVPTRRSLHTLAEHVVAPARHAANGQIGLRFTRGGFGTPYFGDGHQVRVESGRLVVDGVVHTPATLGEAASLAGIPLGMPPEVYLPTTPAAPDTHLPVNPAAAEALGDWFGFAWSVLEQLRFDGRTLHSRAPLRVQLWPEHFDAAVELGDEFAGRRAAFGASPGDDAHPEPYLYVAPWHRRAGGFWNDKAFGGASLTYGALLSADDQRETALAFFRQGLAELNS
ncbi:hypothetical protein [Actinoallomurus iriomotensis]|uniref:Uncharacterized protein n=1 Tax=Actinoallomurus iriomotensis TaxID=478107 RepID=A0A9W6RRB7_9ACTN|nr:hypothetical protein [Actinoallomurus iriomotensis]GLY80159.1 hypothetical protein Airi01_084260 [Actinoallomurus iriomotensis]